MSLDFAWTESDRLTDRQADFLQSPDAEDTVRGVRLRKITPAERELSRRAWQSVVFIDCQLSGCDFSHGLWTDAAFVRCDLSGARFSDCGFQRCQFTGCRMTGVYLTDAALRQTSFEDSVLDWAVFDGANLTKVNLFGVRAHSVSLADCRLKECTLHDADLTGVSLLHTLLSGVDLRRCELSGLIVSENAVELRGARVTGIQAAELARLLGLVVDDGI